MIRLLPEHGKELHNQDSENSYLTDMVEEKESALSVVEDSENSSVEDLRFHERRSHKIHMTSISIPAVDIRPEESLLICCARTTLDSEQADLIRALLHQEMDWLYLISTAHLHGMIPLLYWHLNAICPDAIPKVILDQLAGDFHYNSRRNLFLTGELLKLLNLFESQGIPAIPFKGPTLAFSVYENLAFRQFIDLDILVRKEDVLRVRELLVGQGYRPQFWLTSEQEEVLLQSQCEHSFTQDDKVMIDLHWGFVPRYLSFSLDPDLMLDRLRRISLGGTMVLTFSPEDLLLILSLHGAKHSWKRLDWICDIAEIVRRYKDIDWQRILKQASILCIERMLFLGLFLASNMLGTDLPEEVSQKVENDSVVRSLAKKVRERLFRVNNSHGFFQEAIYLKTMVRWKDRIRHCYKNVITPTPLEWELLPLPKALYFLYYLVRPVRLMGKYAGIFFNTILKFFKSK